MSFSVKLANKIIHIENIYPSLETFFKDYIVKDCGYEISVSWTEDEIMAEQDKCLDQTYSPDYLETLAALRKISNILPFHQRFLIHGASISYQGQAYLFTAPSGTGKSTHIRLWKKYLGDDVKIVNGDKPFVSLDVVDADNHIQPKIYGTPWAGKEGWQQNCEMPLNGICFIQRGESNSIRRMRSEECLSLLFHQVHIPNDPVAAGNTLELIDELLANVPFYLLQCDMSEDAVRCSFETLTGLSYPD